MDVSIICGRCGHLFTSPLILPGETPLFELDLKRIDPQLIAAEFSVRCPRCNSSRGRNDLRPTFAVISELAKSSSSRYEIDALVAAIQKLIDSQTASNAAVKIIIEKEAPSLKGLHRLVPHDAASIYAFLALIIALAALIEATLADLPALSKLFSSKHDNAPSPRTSGPSSSPLIRSPGVPHDPANWPAWRGFMPKLLAANPADSTSRRVQSIACDAVTFLLESGHPKEGRELAQHLYERWRGDDDNFRETERAAELLGEAYRNENRPKRAYEIDTIVLSRRREESGEASSGTLNFMNHVARDLCMMGNYHASFKLHKEVLTCSRRIYGYDDERTLRYSNEVANDLRESGQYNVALKIREDIFARRHRVLGEDHPLTLSTAHDMAADLYMMKRYAEALAIYKDTLARCNRVLGEDHPDTLSTAHDMAADLYMMKRYAEAFAIHKEILDRRRRVLGEDHPDTVVSKSTVRYDREAIESLRLYKNFRSHLESRFRRPNLSTKFHSFSPGPHLGRFQARRAPSLQLRGHRQFEHLVAQRLREIRRL